MSLSKTFLGKLTSILLVVFSTLVLAQALLSIQRIVSTKAPDFEVLWLGARYKAFSDSSNAA